MQSVIIKIIEYNEDQDTLLVKAKADTSSKTIDEYDAKAFQPHALGVYDPQVLYDVIAKASVSTILNQEEEEQAKTDPQVIEAIRGMVGTTKTYDASELYTENPNPVAGFQSDVKQLHDSVPIARSTNVEKILNRQFLNIRIVPITRKSDQNLIGVSCAAAAGAELGTGSQAYKSMLALRDFAIELGVPTFQDVAGPKMQDITDFLVNNGHEVIYGGEINHVYLPWNLGMAKNRKRQIINHEREEEINSGVAWNNYQWDSDSKSRENLAETLVVLGNGYSLPAGFTWRTSDNQDISMTHSDLAALANAMADVKNTAYYDSWQRKAVVESATTETEVNDA